MTKSTIITILLTGASAIPAFGGCQGAAPKGNLVEQLQATYVPTVMEANGLKVAQPGCTLVVQKEGVMANPTSKVFGYYANTYEDGQIVNTKHGIKGVLPGRASFNAGNARALSVGEKAYLLKIEVKDSDIVLYLQTCGTCDPAAADPAHKPFRASVDVRFQKGYLTISDLKHVQQSVADILAFPEATDSNTQTDAGAQSGAQPAQAAPPAAAPPQPAAAPEQPAQQFKPIEPPPPPPPAPNHIEKGQTVDQVTAALGQPETIVKLEGKQIYMFKDLKVTFVNGKVSDVDVR